MARKKVEELLDPENPTLDGFTAAELADDEGWDLSKAIEAEMAAPVAPPAPPPYREEPTPQLTDSPAPIGQSANANRSSSLVSSGRTFDPHDHDWVQHGRMLSCKTCPDNTRHGTIIKPGYMLVGGRGNWELVPERGTPKPKTP